LPLGCDLAEKGKTARPITQVAATALKPIARKTIHLSAKLRPNRNQRRGVFSVGVQFNAQNQVRVRK